MHTIGANAASATWNKNETYKRRPPLTKEQYDAKTMEYPCKVCGNYGQWKRDHKADGSLPHGIKPVDTSEHFKVRSKSGTMRERKKTIIFNIADAIIASPEKIYKGLDKTDTILGPLVDDGAPYSAIGELELTIIIKEHNVTCFNRTENIPNGLHGNTHLQYGTGTHASPPRKIIGSVDIEAMSDSDNPMQIKHIIWRLLHNGSLEKM